MNTLFDQLGVRVSHDNRSPWDVVVIHIEYQGQFIRLILNGGIKLESTKEVKFICKIGEIQLYEVV